MVALGPALGFDDVEGPAGDSPQAARAAAGLMLWLLAGEPDDERQVCPGLLEGAGPGAQLVVFASRPTWSPRARSMNIRTGYGARSA